MTTTNEKSTAGTGFVEVDGGVRGKYMMSATDLHAVHAARWEALSPRTRAAAIAAAATEPGRKSTAETLSCGLTEHERHLMTELAAEDSRFQSLHQIKHNEALRAAGHKGVPTPAPGRAPGAVPSIAYAIALAVECGGAVCNLDRVATAATDLARADMTGGGGGVDAATPPLAPHASRWAALPPPVKTAARAAASSSPGSVTGHTTAEKRLLMDVSDHLTRVQSRVQAGVIKSGSVPTGNYALALAVECGGAECHTARRAAVVEDLERAEVIEVEGAR